MLTSVRSRCPARGVFWGLEKVLAVGAVIGIAATAAAADHQGSKASGGPGSSVKTYKLDDVVTTHANGNPLEVSSVIVTLVPGADLPPQFARFARDGKLDIINGQVLDVPNGLLRQLAADPNIFRVHDDRPIFSHNY